MTWPSSAIRWLVAAVDSSSASESHWLRLVRTSSAAVLLGLQATCGSNGSGAPQPDASGSMGSGGTLGPASVGTTAGASVALGGATITESSGLLSGGTNAQANGGVPNTTGSHAGGSTQLADLPETSCEITVTSAELSERIPTVAIVSFTSNLGGLTAAEIQFGRDASYGLVAPVDRTLEGNRTLLLGMTQDSTYHYRVAVSDGKSVCYGEDRTLTTGTLSSRALAEATTSDRAAPGFIVTSRDNEAVIFNKAGELVWAFRMWNVLSVQMSWDGRYMIGRDPGPFDLGSDGTFYRVKMDGSESAALDAPGGDHHDFTAIPEGVAYLAKANAGECDKVYEASLALTDGAPVFDTWQIFQYFGDEGNVEGTEICHANRIHYSLDTDTYSVSDRNKDALAVFSRSGAPVTSIGKAPIGGWTKHVQAEGAGLGGEWHVQHGHHLYAQDRFVVFTNESSGGAAVLHYTIQGKVATLDWKYVGAGASNIQGDVQRLPNGNFLVTANLSGTIVELGPDGQTEVGRYVLGPPIGPLYGFGYSSHRPTLYGTPPRW